VRRPFFERLLRPIVQVRENEVLTAILLFSYSFLAMTSYNILKPISRSKFITDLGADNMPYVPLTAGVLIGFVMAGYSWLIARLPRRWSLQIAQVVLASVLVGLWVLFQRPSPWVSWAFYFYTLILAVLLISQFWTLANVVYEPRQAKRLFGFIGGGSALGGFTGSLVTMSATKFGTLNLLLPSAGLLLVCAVIVTIVTFRERLEGPTAVEEQHKISLRRPVQLLAKSRPLQLVALVICFGAIGAFTIEQQLNMATEVFKGRHATDAMTVFLSQVQAATSLIGFLIQILLTSRIHRFLGIGFALMVLPAALGSTGLIILLNAALWAPSLARVTDQSLRYNLDKTTREILYMPLPSEVKYEAKPFVDVTVDRFAKGLAALVMLILIKPWGLHLTWQQISYWSVGVTLIWLFAAVQARRGYQQAFRHNLDTQEVKPSDVRLAAADLSTIETLIQELASPDEHRVLYAIDLLESLDKRHLVTPLLLYHESPAVRVRALGVLASTQKVISARWLPAIQRLIGDDDPDVRAAAIGALAKIRDEQVAELARPYLDDSDPRLAMTAALALAQNGNAADTAAAEARLRNLVADGRAQTAPVRRDLAAALGRLEEPHLRPLLIALLNDPDLSVAEEAMRSVRQIGRADFIFVPTLVSLLRHRRLKSSARDALVSYGEEVLDALRHFLRDPDEQIWVRRHLPATLARIPCQKTMDILVEALDEEDGFLRFKLIGAIEALHRARPELTFDRERLTARALEEASQGLVYRQLYRRAFEQAGIPVSGLLAQALGEKIQRARDRVFRLLGILHPWKDIDAARWGVERGDGRTRSGAIEYLDNLLKGAERKRLVPFLEDGLPGPGAAADGTVVSPQLVEEPLRRLIDDRDQVLSASAILLVWELQLRGLVDHVESVLATRDADDWYAFEAASWVLGAFRLSDDKRRALWVEPLPAAEAAQQLRTLPLFASVSADELFRVAATGRQVRYEPSRLLYEEGSLPEELQFLLDGRVTMTTKGGDSAALAPPAALGLEETLEGRPMSASVRTEATTVCLSLGSDQFQTLLADNTKLVKELFRTLASGDGAETGRVVLHGAARPRAAGPTTGLKPIEKVLFLQAIPILSAITADEMLSLASIAKEVPLPAGSVLFRVTDRPALYVIVSGEVSLTPQGDAEAIQADEGDAVGVYQTLAGAPIACEALVIDEGTALRIDREELFDLLSQRPDLLQQLFGALFRVRADRMPRQT
jgi:ATP:ADP antiporter, AAA family